MASARLFADEYLVDFLAKPLGKGAFSTVHRCVCKRDGREYAVKVIKVGSMTQIDKTKIEREADICRRLKHPNIVQMKEFFKEDTEYYLVFELVSGGELFDEIVTRTNYNELDASKCMQSIFLALQECHRNFIVHRDLKPENLLLSTKGPDAIVKLTDFGLAVSFEKGLASFGFAGTPGYLAPEVCKRLPYGAPVDMWACGVITYILLAGYPPFYDEDNKRMYEQIKSGEYKFNSPEWDNVTNEAKHLIRSLLELNPEKRYTVEQALAHPWISRAEQVAAKIHRQGTLELLEKFNARGKVKLGIKAVMAANWFSKPSLSMAQAPNPSTHAVKSSSAEMVLEDPDLTRDQRVVMDLTKQLIRSIATRDWGKYSGMTSPSLTCFEPEAPGVLIEGLDFHKFYFDHGKAIVNNTLLDMRAQVFDGTAIVTYVRVMQIAHGHEIHTVKSEETKIWRKTSETWVQVHFHRSCAGH